MGSASTASGSSTASSISLAAGSERRSWLSRVAPASRTVTPTAGPRALDDVEPRVGQEPDRLQRAQPDQLLVARLERQRVEHPVEIAGVQRHRASHAEEAAGTRRAGDPVFSINRSTRGRAAGDTPRARGSRASRPGGSGRSSSTEHRGAPRSSGGVARASSATGSTPSASRSSSVAPPGSSLCISSGMCRSRYAARPSATGSSRGELLRPCRAPSPSTGPSPE